MSMIIFTKMLVNEKEFVFAKRRLNPGGFVRVNMTITQQFVGSLRGEVPVVFEHTSTSSGLCSACWPLPEAPTAAVTLLRVTIVVEVVLCSSGSSRTVVVQIYLIFIVQTIFCIKLSINNHIIRLVNKNHIIQTCKKIQVTSTHAICCCNCNFRFFSLPGGSKSPRKGGKKEKRKNRGGGKKPVVFGKQAAHTCFAPYQTYVRVRVRCLDPHLCYLSTAR